MSDFKPVKPGIPEDDDPNEEFPFLHTVTVVDRAVSVDKPELVQNNIRTETVTLDLDSEWDGLSCIINIGNGDTPTSLIWSGQPVTIPAELMTNIGTLNVSVVGYGDDGALRAVTKKADAMFTVVASGYVEGDEPVPDPTTILGQLTEAADRANQAAQNAEDSTIDNVNVTMLPTGSSASGSVSDKTLSLSIPNGPQGPQGPKGDPGDLTTVTHDDTLTGDGTSDTPLGIASGLNFSNFDTKLTWATPLSSVNTPGMHRIRGNTQDSPDDDIPDFIKGRTNVAAILLVYKNSSSFLKIMYVQYADVVGHMVRCFGKTYTDSGSSAWIDLNHSGSTVSALTSRVTALEAKLNELAVTQTRLQALETRIKSSETNQ